MRKNVRKKFHWNSRHDEVNEEMWFLLGPLSNTKLSELGLRRVVLNLDAKFFCDSCSHNSSLC